MNSSRDFRSKDDSAFAPTPFLNIVRLKKVGELTTFTGTMPERESSSAIVIKPVP